MFRGVDYSVLKEIMWDSEILGYIGNIREYKGRFSVFLSLKKEDFDDFSKEAMRDSTEASNAIEGIVTMKQRFTQLIEHATEPVIRNENDILGYYSALQRIYSKDTEKHIGADTVVMLHKTMYEISGVSFGGRFKEADYDLGDGYQDAAGNLFGTGDIVGVICREYEKAVSEYMIDPLIAIPFFIHDFMAVSPFYDGNGRLSRILLNYLLYMSGHDVVKYVSVEKIMRRSRDEYQEALRSSTKGWNEGEDNAAPFIKYILWLVLEAYRELDSKLGFGEPQRKLSAREMVNRAVSGQSGEFTKSAILSVCPGIGRGSVELCLKAMCEEGLIVKKGGGRSTYYEKRAMP